MKFIYLFLLLVIISSCAINYQPVPQPGVLISENYAILKKTDYTLIVEYRYWIKTPQNLSDYFTTFYITVINKSKKVLNISPADIYLLDENGKQYDVVPIEDIYNLIFTGEENIKLLFDEKDENEYKNMLYEKQEAKKNIMNYSFSFGKLVKGAKKTGYVFFNKLPADNRKCKIIFKGDAISFIRTK